MYDMKTVKPFIFRI